MKEHLLIFWQRKLEDAYRENYDLHAENARLKTEVDRLTNDFPKMVAWGRGLEHDKRLLEEEVSRLKAEVDQLTYVDDFIVITRASIKALTEEGVQNTPGQYDEKYTISVSKACYIKVLKHMSEFWEAKKKGGQS